ncbi:hypothetical protein [Streptomyces sp. NBC_01363]|uniref:hypothetical protein n=1 Tax=Streptomyces sp. NBC_01363 TaxID=2903840 RepID=UPI00224FB69B|nr:hypothetical protein [Streptomyces sp. NBC_01363]MCX4732207.1 hypothetical protein [Streptomyces sp. NBC_01363]
MRSVRLVTGTAASAVAIATLGFLTAGPPAYAGDADALRSSAAETASRTTGALGTRADGEEGSGDGTGSGTGDGTGSGTANPFSLDNLSGLNLPSLLDSTGGVDKSSGRDNPSGDEETDRGESSSSERDNSSPSGQDSSGARESRSPSEEEGSGKRDDSSSSGRDSSSSGRDDSSSSGHSPGDAPSGHVKTGVGGSVRPDTTQIAAGAGVLAAAAVGGAWLLRRRASGTQGAG